MIGQSFLPKISRSTIDNPSQLLELISDIYMQSEGSLGLVSISQILPYIKDMSGYTEKKFKEHLIYLELTHQIKLKTTSSRFALNMGIALIYIQGVSYGYIKILGARENAGSALKIRE